MPKMVSLENRLPWLVVQEIIVEWYWTFVDFHLVKCCKLKAKLMKIPELHQMTQLRSHAWVNDSLTFVAKCAHDVILYVFVVEKNVTMAKSGIQTMINTISSCWKLWTFSWKGILGCSTRHRQFICLTRQQLYWWCIEPHYMSYHWKQRFSTCFWCLQSNNMVYKQYLAEL